MASGKSLELAAIQPPEPRMVWQSTDFLLASGHVAKGSGPLRLKPLKPSQRSTKPRRVVAPQFSTDHLKIARLAMEEKQDFRARRRAWVGGAKHVVTRLFDGLRDLCGGATT